MDYILTFITALMAIFSNDDLEVASVGILKTLIRFAIQRSIELTVIKSRHVYRNVSLRLLFHFSGLIVYRVTSLTLNYA